MCWSRAVAHRKGLMRFSSPWKDCFFQEESVANHRKSQSWEDDYLGGDRSCKFCTIELKRALFIWNKQVLQKSVGWEAFSLQFLCKTLSQSLGYHILGRATSVHYSGCWASIGLSLNFSHDTSYLGNSPAFSEIITEYSVSSSHLQNHYCTQTKSLLGAQVISQKAGCHFM